MCFKMVFNVLTLIGAFGRYRVYRANVSTLVLVFMYIYVRTYVRSRVS